VATIGIDPGSQGALALVYDDGTLAEVVDMPYAARMTNGHEVRLLLERWRPLVDLVVLELVGPRPHEGSAASFTFGQGFGILRGVLIGAGMTTELVTPGAWKASMGLPPIKGESDAARKDRARLKAQDTWPGSAELFKRKKDDGRAEAALIGLYGLKFRRLAGTLPAEEEVLPW